MEEANTLYIHKGKIFIKNPTAFGVVVNDEFSRKLNNILGKLRLGNGGHIIIGYDTATATIEPLDPTQIPDLIQQIAKSLVAHCYFPDDCEIKQFPIPDMKKIVMSLNIKPV